MESVDLGYGTKPLMTAAAAADDLCVCVRVCVRETVRAKPRAKNLGLPVQTRENRKQRRRDQPESEAAKDSVISHHTTSNLSKIKPYTHIDFSQDLGPSLLFSLDWKLHEPQFKHEPHEAILHKSTSQWKPVEAQKAAPCPSGLGSGTNTSPNQPTRAITSVTTTSDQ